MTEKYTYVKMVKSFAYEAAMWNVIGSPVRTIDQQDSIASTCNECEHIDNRKCSICQCSVYRGSSKLAWASTSCPEGKWGPRRDLVEMIKMIHNAHEKERSSRNQPDRVKSRGGCCGGSKKDV